MQPPDRADQAEPGCLISWRLVSLFRDRAAISRGLTILLLLRYSSMVLCKLDDRKPGAVTSIAFITDLRYNLQFSDRLSVDARRISAFVQQDARKRSRPNQQRFGNLESPQHREAAECNQCSWNI